MSAADQEPRADPVMRHDIDLAVERNRAVRARVLAIALVAGALASGLGIPTRTSPWDALALAGFTVGCAALAVLVWRAHRAAPAVAIAGVGATAVSLMATLAILLHGPGSPDPLALADLLYWFPVASALAFLALPPRAAIAGNAAFVAGATLLCLAAMFTSTPELRSVLERFVLGLVGFVLVQCASVALQERSALADATVEHLSAIAWFDPLTGLVNRRRLDELTRRLLEGPAGEPVAGILIDIDHFKAVNDRCGHAAGDVVLVTLAQTLRQHLRPMDVVGRWGGEEFLVLLRGSPPDRAGIVAERLRVAIAAEVAVEGQAVTASLGLATGTLPLDERAWFEAMDGALYAAKDAGRDRVHTVVVGSAPPSAP